MTKMKIVLVHARDKTPFRMRHSTCFGASASMDKHACFS